MLESPIKFINIIVSPPPVIIASHPEKMARREPVSLDCKVYVGELGNNGTRHEIEDAFGYYGPLKEVGVHRVIIIFNFFF